MISNFMPPGLLSMAAALCLTGGGLKAKERAKLLKRRKCVRKHEQWILSQKSIQKIHGTLIT